MTKKEHALALVEKLMKEEYQMPDRFGISLDTYIFRAYQSWAIRDLYKYLTTADEKDPMAIFDNYICIADMNACYAKDELFSFKWSVASDVGTCILDDWLIIVEDNYDTNPV